ncbi:hypothetical protein B0H13DRAFT_2344071 [Mycena leptocephala]|nr:hypothetical protein B0H13DRAFT_2344071 [Mycena leptocephala]
MFGPSGYRGTTADTANVSTCFPPSRPVALTLAPTVMASTPPNGKTVVVLGAASGGLLEGGIHTSIRYILPRSRSYLGTNIKLARPSVSFKFFQPALFLTTPFHYAVIPYDNIFNLGPSIHSFRERPMHSIHPSHHPRPHPALPHPLVRGAQAEVEKDGVLCSDYAVYALGSRLPAPLNLWDTSAHPTLHAPYAYGRTKAGIAWLKRKQHVVEEAASVLVLLGVGSLGIQFASDIAAIHPTKHVTVTVLRSRARLLPLPRFGGSVGGGLAGAEGQGEEKSGDGGEGETLQALHALNSQDDDSTEDEGREIGADLVLLLPAKWPNTLNAHHRPPALDARAVVFDPANRSGLGRLGRLLTGEGRRLPPLLADEDRRMRLLADEDRRVRVRVDDAARDYSCAANGGISDEDRHKRMHGAPKKKRTDARARLPWRKEEPAAAPAPPFRSLTDKDSKDVSLLAAALAETELLDAASESASSASYSLYHTEPATPAAAQHPLLAALDPRVVSSMPRAGWRGWGGCGATMQLVAAASMEGVRVRLLSGRGSASAGDEGGEARENNTALLHTLDPCVVDPTSGVGRVRRTMQLAFVSEGMRVRVQMRGKREGATRRKERAETGEEEDEECARSCILPTRTKEGTEEEYAPTRRKDDASLLAAALAEIELLDARQTRTNPIMMTWRPPARREADASALPALTPETVALEGTQRSAWAQGELAGRNVLRPISRLGGSADAGKGEKRDENGEKEDEAEEHEELETYPARWRSGCRLGW